MKIEIKPNQEVIVDLLDDLIIIRESEKSIKAFTFDEIREAGGGFVVQYPYKKYTPGTQKGKELLDAIEVLRSVRGLDRALRNGVLRINV